MDIDPRLLQLLVASVLPFLVALVTKQNLSSGWKGIILAALSALTAGANAALHDAGVLTQDTLYLAVDSFVISAAAYFGIWKPTGATEKVATKTEKIGVGPS